MASTYKSSQLFPLLFIVNVNPKWSWQPQCTSRNTYAPHRCTHWHSVLVRDACFKEKLRRGKSSAAGTYSVILAHQHSRIARYFYPCHTLGIKIRSMVFIGIGFWRKIPIAIPPPARSPPFFVTPVTWLGFHFPLRSLPHENEIGVHADPCTATPAGCDIPRAEV